MNEHQIKIQQARDIAEANRHQPKVLHRTSDGEAAYPFKAAFYTAMLPDLLARGDALLADLNSQDYAVRIRAERGIDRIQKQIEDLGNPEK